MPLKKTPCKRAATSKRHERQLRNLELYRPGEPHMHKAESSLSKSFRSRLAVGNHYCAVHAQSL